MTPRAVFCTAKYL